MIHTENKDISRLNAFSKVVAYTRVGSNLVWQAIKSCFGLGYFVNNKEWSNTDAWKN